MSRAMIAPEYDVPIRKTLLHQCVWATFAMLMLDAGVFARVVATAMLAFWFSAAFLIIRRPDHLDDSDRKFLEQAFFRILIVVSSVQTVFGNF